jgi:hypothetical protein
VDGFTHTTADEPATVPGTTIDTGEYIAAADTEESNTGADRLDGDASEYVQNDDGDANPDDYLPEYETSAEAATAAVPDADYIPEDADEEAADEEEAVAEDDPDYIPLSEKEVQKELRKAEKRRKRRQKKMAAQAEKELVRYLCVKAPGAVVREGAEMSSAKTGQYVYVDEVVVAYEQTINSDGVHRLRCERGWISVTSADGLTVVLEPTSLPATGAVTLDGSGADQAVDGQAQTSAEAPSPSPSRVKQKGKDEWVDSRSKRPPPRRKNKDAGKPRVKWDLGGLSAPGTDYHHPTRKASPSGFGPIPVDEDNIASLDKQAHKLRKAQKKAHKVEKELETVLRGVDVVPPPPNSQRKLPGTTAEKLLAAQEMEEKAKETVEEEEADAAAVPTSEAEAPTAAQEDAEDDGTEDDADDIAAILQQREAAAAQKKQEEKANRKLARQAKREAAEKLRVAEEKMQQRTELDRLAQEAEERLAQAAAALQQADDEEELDAAVDASMHDGAEQHGSATTNDETGDNSDSDSDDDSEGVSDDDADNDEDWLAGVEKKLQEKQQQQQQEHSEQEAKEESGRARERARYARKMQKKAEAKAARKAAKAAKEKDAKVSSSTSEATSPADASGTADPGSTAEEQTAKGGEGDHHHRHRHDRDDDHPDEAADKAKKARRDAKRSGKRIYECVCGGGAVIRAGPALDSPKVGILQPGDFAVSIEEAILMSSTTRRVKFHHKPLSVSGWLSVTASDGSKILQPLWSGGVKEIFGDENGDDAAMDAATAETIRQEKMKLKEQEKEQREKERAEAKAKEREKEKEKKAEKERKREERHREKEEAKEKEKEKKHRSDRKHGSSSSSSSSSKEKKHHHHHHHRSSHGTEASAGPPPPPPPAGAAAAAAASSSSPSSASTAAAASGSSSSSSSCWKMAMDPMRRRPYYFNESTLEVVWQRPEELRGASLGISASAPPPPPHAPTAAPATPQGAAQEASQKAAEYATLEREWVEHTEPKTGRKFFVNTRLNQTSWERPTYDPVILQRQEERLAAHRQAAEDKAAADAAASSVDSEVEAAVQQWAKRSSRGHTTRSHGLRTLLATLPSMWPAAAAADPLFADGTALASCESGQVRKCYLKAVRLVHPDKIQGVGGGGGGGDDDDLALVRKRVLAQKLFAVLSEAWAKFQKE